MEDATKKVLNDLYLPDGTGGRLNTLLWGQAGSGKTTYLETTLYHFLKTNKDPEFRVVYISPKHETLLGQEPLYNIEKLEKYLMKNRFAVVFPSMESLDADVDYIIDTLFDLRQANPPYKKSKGFTATVIMDDAQIFLSSRKAASPAQKRLALTGRSKMIRGIYVSHNIVFAKELEGQVSTLIGFTTPVPSYWKASIERYGYDPEDFASDLASKPFTYVWFDTKTRNGELNEPIEPIV